MATCPNINLDSWKQLVDAQGEDLAYYLWDKYNGEVPENFELPTTLSKPSIERVKEVIAKMGVSLQALSDYAKTAGLDITGINAVADLARNIIAIADGKEAEALTEEMVHIATAIIEQKNPQLITQLISKIDKFKIYKETLETYRNNPNYQLPNGKPDIRKIKKEAVDKLISEMIVNKLENVEAYPEMAEAENQNLILSMWQTILDVIKSLYVKADVDLFRDVSEMIMEGEIGTLGENHGMGTFYQVITDKQQSVLDRLEQTKNSITKKIEIEEPVDPMFMDTEEARNYYVRKTADGKEVVVKNRTTDRVKEFYRKTFPNARFSEADKVKNEIKRRFGVRGHSDFEAMHKRFYNPDGTKREVPLDPPFAPNVQDKQLYQMLEDWFVEWTDTLPEGSLVLSEVMIYDETADEAGTIDLLVITPEGDAMIHDWKFMSVAEGSEDIPIWKQGGYNIQLNRYAEVISKKYGVNEVLKKSAIPIIMDIEYNTRKDSRLVGLEIGSVDPRKIDKPYLIPVTPDAPSTGFKELDALLDKVSSLISQIEKENVTDMEERRSKNERLNALRSAVRIVRGTTKLAPLIDVVVALANEGKRVLNNYEVNFKDRPATSLDSTNKELSDQSYDMMNFINVSELFQTLGSEIGHLIYTKDMENDEASEEEQAVIKRRKEILSDIVNVSKELFDTRRAMIDAKMKFADKHIGERNQTTGLLTPEKVQKGLSSMFTGAADFGLRSVRLLYKIIRAAMGNASAESLQEVKRIMDIRKRIMDRGVDVRSFVKNIYQKDAGGNLVNKIIRKYSREFYDEMDRVAAEGGSMVWLKNNVDMEAYQIEASKYIKERINKIYQNYNYDPTMDDDANIGSGNITSKQLDKMYYAVDDVYRKFDISSPSFNGYNNFILKRHPKEEWLSEDYKKITQDKDLLDLYNFITEINEKAKNIGYIDNNVASSFLPFIRKGTAEELSTDGIISAIKNFNDRVKTSISINAEDYALGKINDVTGELENGIPKYYTADFTRLPDGTNDYSDVSEDIFRNMILYLQQVNKYKYLSEVEDQILLIKSVEKFKDVHYQTTTTGDIVYDEEGKPKEEKGNAENVKTFDDFMRVLLYNQKYPGSSSDVPIKPGAALSFVKKAVNKVAGREVFKPNEEATPISLIRTIDAANRAFQLKTLGFEAISGAVNAFGGSVQLVTQAGNYFKAREFVKNSTKIIKREFARAEDEDTFMELVNTFMPMKDDPVYDELNKAGITRMTRGNIGDFLMFFMRKPEQIIEKASFLTLLDNTMVEDGKLVNIVEFVKKKYEGKRYTSSTSFKETQVKIDQEIEELKKRSVSNTAKLVDGKLEIPGLDLSNRTEIQKLTNLARRISRNATGGMSDGDINRMSMSVWTASMMVFKNWIPKLLDTRFSEFKKVSDDFSVVVSEDGITEGEKYDIGRIRLLGRMIVDSIAKTQITMANVLAVNEKGLEYLDELYVKYAEDYKKQTGEDLNMTRDQFYDLMRNNLRRQLQELALLGSLLGAALAIGFISPDDDEDRATKNFHRYVLKTIDKFVSELSFFYNPLEFAKLLASGMFPAIGLVNDFLRFVSAFFSEITGRAIGDDEMTKEAKPIKYAMKMVPVTKPLVTYLSILSEDFAKEFDVTIQKESNIR